MTKYFYLLPILPTMLAAAPAEGVTPQLVPLPKTATMGQGVLALTSATRIMATSKELEPLAQVLSDEIFLTTGVRLAAAGRTSDAMPDVAKLRPIATGKLARFESTGKLARDLGGPLILAASGQFEALTAGEYRIVCRGKNVQLTVAGKVVAIQKDGIAPVTLAVGRHPISVLQSPGDGNVGVVLTMDKAPPDPISTDPAKPARRFTSEYLHQWMAPLPH